MVRILLRLVFVVCLSQTPLFERVRLSGVRALGRMFGVSVRTPPLSGVWIPGRIFGVYVWIP